jgi:hypothetical protein
MRINRDLKLVIPVYEEDEHLLTIYAEPLNRMAFEAHHKIMARAWTDLNAAGIGSVGLMTTALFAIKEASTSLYGEINGPQRYFSFVTEMLRTAQAIIPKTGTWQPVPYENAKATGIITEDDAATVESLIAFFTLGSRMVDPHWGKILRTAMQLSYSAQYTSLTCMAYAATLTTSTRDASSGKKTT